MRIRADEHVAQAIVEAINQIAISDGFELTSVRSAGQRGSSDVHWITAFAEEGGSAILTADTDFLKEPPQVLAVQKAGIRVIHLPAGWANASLAMQAAHLLQWWRRIELQLGNMKPRECYQPPFALKEDTDLKKIALDFQGAQKKAKKAQRSSRSDASPPSRKIDLS